MNWFDIVLLGVIALSLLAGFIKGLVREVFSLGGVILAVLCAFMFAPGLQGAFEKWIPLESAAYAAALVVIFLLVMIVTEVAARFVQKLLNLAQLGFANIMQGGIFGVVRGVVITMILVLGVALFLEPGHPVLADSAVVPYLSRTSELMSPLLPEDAQEELKKQFDELRSKRKLVDLI